MAKKRKYSGIKKPEASEAKFALILGAVSAAAFLAGIIISYVFAGNAGLFTGAIGLGGFLVAVYGCIYALKGLAAKEKSHKLSYYAVILSGIMIIIWIATCFAGV